MLKLKSTRFVLSALGTALLGFSALATTGAAYASDPGDYDAQMPQAYFDKFNHNEDRTFGDWADDDGDFFGMRDADRQDDWWRDHQFGDWDREAFDRECLKESLRVTINRLYLGGTTSTESDYAGFVSTGLAGLVQDAATVIGIDTQVVYNELAGGRSLVEIGIDRGIGEMALREGLIELNPDLASLASSLVHEHHLLTMSSYIPV